MQIHTFYLCLVYFFKTIIVSLKFFLQNDLIKSLLSIVTSQLEDFPWMTNLVVLWVKLFHTHLIDSCMVPIVSFSPNKIIFNFYLKNIK
jgi:hypothetical protein